jgi:hypothetical protein
MMTQPLMLIIISVVGTMVYRRLRKEKQDKKADAARDAAGHDEMQ